MKVIAANDRLALAALIPSLGDIVATKEEIARISQPLLALLGENDGNMAGVRAMEGVATQTEVVVIKGRGHGDAYTTPEFVAAIERFLQQVDGS